MLIPPMLESELRQMSPEQLLAALAHFLPEGTTTAERTSAVEAALRSPAGALIRAEMGRWITEQIVPVKVLVPEAYALWRPPVRDAMQFVVAHLSVERLAPKLVEQLELPPKTSPEVRLLRLIAKVPGLQKLGQVISRNRHLRPALRRALAELENGIHDVRAKDMCAIIQREVGSQLEAFAVEMESAILCEASVSAVVRFTWRDPDSGKRERGVFKVLKPHIPACFAEDMEILQALAEFFGARHDEYDFATHVIPDTFTKVRRLLQHEVDFPGEQRTLLEAGNLYRNFPGIRVPRVIPPLCTANVTAITEEHGAKVTSAATRMSAARRQQVAEQLVEALVGIPLLSADEDVIFHADPHAGNLLYNGDSGELVILDWALTERLSREQRRQLALLFVNVGLRDPVGIGNAVMGLRQRVRGRNAPSREAVRECVSDFLDEFPLSYLPTSVDAMELLERLALKGIRFPAPLIMLSKVVFTLDGILHDIGVSEIWNSFSVARHLVQRWLSHREAFASPLRSKDWIVVLCSAMLYSGRMWVKWEQQALDRWLPREAVEALPK